MIKRGDAVNILPEYRNPGENKFVWVAVNDEQDGKVNICPLTAKNPTELIEEVDVWMIEPKGINLLPEQILKDCPSIHLPN